MPDFGGGFPLAQGGDEPLGRNKAVGHADLGQRFLEGQEHAVGQPVADFAALGVVDGDRPRIPSLSGTPEEAPGNPVTNGLDVVVGPGIVDHLLVVPADDGLGPAVAADEERGMPGQVARDQKGQDGVAVDRRFPGEGQPAVQVEFPEQAGGLCGFFL